MRIAADTVAVYAMTLLVREMPALVKGKFAMKLWTEIYLKKSTSGTSY